MEVYFPGAKTEAIREGGQSWVLAREVLFNTRRNQQRSEGGYNCHS